MVYLVISLKLFFEVYFFILRERETERERERENRRGAEREEDRESQADSAPSVQSPMQGSNA